MPKRLFVALIGICACSVTADEPPKRLIFQGQDEVATENQIRTIQSVRVAEPPVLDGKLDDACWDAARGISGFKQYGSESQARFQTVGYVVHDEENLYVGFGCIEPKPESLKIRPADEPVDPDTDEGSLFGYDSVEVMLKPRHWAPEFYQFATDISGANYDAFRTHGGGTINDAWRGTAETAAQVGDDHWSAELKIPFYCLELAPGTRSDWRINLCRSKQRPHELSAIARDGLFNEAHKFAILTGLDVDFSKFYFNVSGPELVGEVGDGGAAASAWATLSNNTGTDRHVRVEYLGADGPIRAEDLALAAGGEACGEDCPRGCSREHGPPVRVNLGEVSLSDQPIEGSSVFEVTGQAAVRQIVITDVGSGDTLALLNLQYPSRLELLGVDLVRSNEEEMQSAEHPLTMEVSSAIGESSRKKGQLVVHVMLEGRPAALASRIISAPDRVTRFTLDRASWPIGKIRIHGEFQAAGGQAVAQANRAFFNVPRRETVGKVLNNWVTELINVRAGEISDPGLVTFTNPRNGWIYISVGTTGGDARLTLDDEDRVHYTHGVGDPADQPMTREAMRWLSAGEHTLTVDVSNGVTLEHLIIRAIPELAFWRFTTRAYYNDMVTEEVFKVVNAVGCIRAVSEKPEYQHLVERWKKEGKRLIMGGAHVPAYTIPELTAEKAYQFWRGYVGYERPRFDAIIADEFGVGDFPVGAYEMMAQALRRLTAEFPGKLFYPFSMDIYGVQGVKSFMEAVIDTGAPIVWEWYEREEPDMESGWEKINSTVTHGMEGWRDFLFEAENHIEVCLGYYNILGESLNENPAVDFKVWMDMQYYQLATHPSFDGLYGVMNYNAKRADGETLRWQAAIHRHYGIEGNTNLLSDVYGYKYRPGILQNPDFDDGTDGWTIEPAEPGTINTGNIPGLGRLEGRVRGSSRGDNLLRMKRSAEGPNRFSQEMKNLVPGNLYSLKMITGDYGDLVNGVSAEKKHAVTIDMENVEPHPTRMPEHIVYESTRGQEAHPFSRDNQPWFNTYWRVFRANAETAMLTISDWAGVDEPGGEVGQKLMYNFIEVQPYFDLE